MRRIIIRVPVGTKSGHTEFGWHIIHWTEISIGRIFQYKLATEVGSTKRLIFERRFFLQIRFDGGFRWFEVIGTGIFSVGAINYPIYDQI